MKLTIEDVSKQYRRDFWALRHFTLELGPGVLGLLGPNGAGKSTLLVIVGDLDTWDQALAEGFIQSIK
jgi:ABC-2 type transport system ATP-binding protein